MSSRAEQEQLNGFIPAAVIGIVVLIAVVILWWFVGYPYYHVWQQSMVGKAKLAEAEYSRQVLIQEAHAKMEAAKNLAQAEVERAKGVSEANRIIGDSLKNNEAYLTYLWLHGLETGSNDVIYIPTEAGLPIFEAGGRFHRDRRASTEEQ